MNQKLFMFRRRKRFGFEEVSIFPRLFGEFRVDSGSFQGMIDIGLFWTNMTVSGRECWGKSKEFVFGYIS